MQPGVLKEAPMGLSVLHASASQTFVVDVYCVFQVATNLRLFTPACEQKAVEAQCEDQERQQTSYPSQAPCAVEPASNCIRAAQAN